MAINYRLPWVWLASGVVVGLLLAIPIAAVGGHHGAWFNDFLRAVAEVMKGVAWPVLIVLLVWAYRTEVHDLLLRLQEFLGAKFYPPQQHQGETATIPVDEALQSLAPAPGLTGAPPADGLPPVLQRVRTETVMAAEQQLLATNELVALNEPQARIAALSTIAAAMLVFGQFERVEGLIWQSQLDLLHFLNGAPAGGTIDTVKGFYDAAAKRFPAWFANYSFDEYLSFLVSFGLVVSGPPVTITERGREYLVWRVQQRRLPKVAG